MLNLIQDSQPTHPESPDQPAKFTFTELADTANDFTTFGSIALNNQGVVAFSAGIEASGGIYTTDGQAITTIADIDTLPALFTDIKPDPGQASITVSNFNYGVFAINNAGSVLFSATGNILPGTSSFYTSAYKRLFLSQGDTIKSVAERIDFNGGTTVTVTNRYTGAGVNDSGQIVYSDETQTRNPRVYTNTEIFVDGRPIAGGAIPASGPPSQVSFPVINNQGTVFYNQSGYLDGINYTNNILRLGSEDSTPVAVSPQLGYSGFPLGSVESLAANDQGDIVFSGSLASGETGLFLLDDGVITSAIRC